MSALSERPVVALIRRHPNREFAGHLKMRPIVSRMQREYGRFIDINEGNQLHDASNNVHMLVESLGVDVSVKVPA